MSDMAPMLGCCCCVLCLVFILVFVLTSIKTVDQTEWCLKYDWLSESVAEEAFTQPGFQWVGLGNFLICYPNTNKYVYFRNNQATSTPGLDEKGDVWNPPLRVRTKDGLAVNLELEFVYMLRSADLRNLYMLVGDSQYHAHMVHIAVGILVNYAATFKAVDFFSNRTLVSHTFQEEVTKALSERLFIDVQTLQLQPAHFPDAYNNIITETQKQRTEIEIANQERTTRLTQKKTELITAKELAEQVKIQAQAHARKTQLDNDAQCQQYLYRTGKDAEGYNAALAFFNDYENAVARFMDYLTVSAMKEHDDVAKTVQLTASR